MKLDTLTEVKHIAEEKYQEYKNAPKNALSKVYKDAARLYYQIKKGRKIIEIGKVIKAGGVHENGHPKLAIAKASNKTVTCHYYQNGDVKYLNGKPGGRLREYAHDVCIKNGLPEFALKNSWDNKVVLTAPVPIVPPKHLPQSLTDDYYILWEVDEWKMIAPTDPYLLKRLTRSHFIVVAGWDLTEVEKSVMNANL